MIAGMALVTYLTRAPLLMIAGPAAAAAAAAPLAPPDPARRAARARGAAGAGLRTQRHAWSRLDLAHPPLWGAIVVLVLAALARESAGHGRGRRSATSRSCARWAERLRGRVRYYRRDDGAVHRRGARGRSLRTSPTSTGPSSRSSTSPRSSRARCSRATRARRSRCAGCSSTSSSRPDGRRRARRDGRTRARAEQLYERVFFEYGDDSVAQLGGVHLACEGASNILTKVLEWGRLMAYLEQSTRYIPYDDRPGGRYRYHVPAELTGAAARALRRDARRAFDTYREWLPRVRAFYEARHPRRPASPSPSTASTIRAKALDTLRGLLPAATDLQRRHLRHRPGVRAAAAAHARAPAGRGARVRRPDAGRAAQGDPGVPARGWTCPERGGVWSAYLADDAGRDREAAARVLASPEASAQATTPRGTAAGDDGGHADRLRSRRRGEGRGRRALRGHRPPGRRAAGDRPRADAPSSAPTCCAPTSATRQNRRHRPGRAFERTAYRFDVLGDYGAFRDLQRHRLLTLEWQRLSPRHGWVMPEAVDEAGGAEALAARDGRRRPRCTTRSRRPGCPRSRPTPCAMAYRVRFYMEMNAREAMHVIELRTAPQGHPSYRRVCQAHAPAHRRAGRPPRDRRRDDVRRPLGGRRSSGWKPSAPPSAVAPGADRRSARLRSARPA